MEPDEICRLFNLLRGGKIESANWDETDLRFVLHHPKLADRCMPESSKFFCTLKQCTEIKLQPFRNASTTIDGLDQILQLEIQILGDGKVSGGKVKVDCKHTASDSGGSLIVKADSLFVYDESFDQLTIERLMGLRSAP